MSDFTDCPCALLDGTPQLGEIWADIDPANVPWLLPLDLMFLKGKKQIGFDVQFLDMDFWMFWRCVVFFFVRLL